MIEKVIEWSARNKYIVLLISAFIIGYGIFVYSRLKLDGIPDLSENQVIIFTEWVGRSPSLIEDQITYPISVGLQGLANVKAVRSYSMFGMSFVFIIFEDGTDIYFARNRVQEKLSEIKRLLPAQAFSTMGPDGTGIGHIFWYTLKSNEHDLGTLRAIQDWNIRFQLASIEGVAEIASMGGFIRQYQIDVVPDKLRSYNISVREIIDAIKKTTTIKADIENISIKSNQNGTPILIKHVAYVQLGGDSRRGVIETNGKGESVGGIVIMRDGENTVSVIDRVKKRLEEIEPSLPKGISIEVAYDRSELIHESTKTLLYALLEASITISLVVMIFLLHARSVVRILIELPITVLLTFILMDLFDITSNIMSLGGIILAVGVVVDSSIVLVENAHRSISQALKQQTSLTKNDYIKLSIQSAKQVGRAIFFSELIILVAFLPVFFLTGQEGKLFHPLAFTKTFAMFGSAFVVITIVPALMVLLAGGKFKPEESNFLNRFFIAHYKPIIVWVLKHPKSVITINIVILATTIPMLLKTGSEFMPALDEGSILYMPVSTPNISVPEITSLLQRQDAIIKEVPEVKHVLGKAGRAETATDNAPINMIETIILLKSKSEWREGVTKQDIINELNKKLSMPGIRNGWTQPIINRINMLSTGVRTDVGLKIYGTNLDTLESLAEKAEHVIKSVEGAADVTAERTQLGQYLNINLKRDAIARYGINTDDVQEMIELAVGGENIGTVYDNRQRFPIRVRFAKDYREDIEAIKNIYIPINLKNQPTTESKPLVEPKENEQKAFIPLSYLADFTLDYGPSMIASENGMLRSVVFFNARGRDVSSVASDSKQAISNHLFLPPGYSVQWTGQYEQKLEADKKLMGIIPLVLLIILSLLYFVFHDWKESFVVMLSVPFALVGGVYMIYALNYNFSVAVWVGFIALYGIAVETGVVMVVYLHEALDKRLKEVHEGLREKITIQDIYDATIEGSVLRLRPKLMTIFTSMFGLIPVMWSTGIGADVMQPLVAPMIGGLFTSAVHVLVVTPVLFVIMKTYLLKQGKLELSRMANWMK
ncbi:hypothetical protein CHS0354_000519 [Potamilus streckersoni]|uniref:Uncharacterized protein n=1 Tax=Potamilus streckersoni TaxID=2493646 RepID=A0AAE0T6S7_9BIVA|nr:hypothetical protein CHS0354_000519 [Potamilus streckersoni]